MSTQVHGGPKQREIELRLTGLIFVRALRAAGGASAEELQRFSAEIRRERRRLEAQRDQDQPGFAEAA
jgi:hypothetical protein